MQVLKFGGSSVADPEAFTAVIGIIKNFTLKKDSKVIVVVSALGGTTDLLLNCAAKASSGNVSYKELLVENEHRHLHLVKKLFPLKEQSGVLTMVKKYCNHLEDFCNGIFLLGEMSERARDKVLSFGELMSSSIMCKALISEGMKAEWVNAEELIVTNSDHGCAKVDFDITNDKIVRLFTNNDSALLVVPGFIAADQQGNITTLGRGGSDYTAAIFAAAINAEELQIWTDVPGMMSADPKLVSNAKVLDEISYQEAMELSHFGAKVIYPPTLQPVMQKKLPVLIKNTFYPEDKGTAIHADHKSNKNVCGISSISKLSLITLEGSGMIGIPGFSRRLFEVLSVNKINVILITQGSSEHSICAGIDESNSLKARTAVDNEFSVEIIKGSLDPLMVEDGLSIVALVGDKMKNHPGISGKMFHILGRNGINVRAIAQGSSERNISAVISTSDVKKAVNVLHEEFFEATFKQLNLYICGTGNVGSKLLAQLILQKEDLQKELRLQVKLAGICNSRKMAFDQEGIDMNEWKPVLENGTNMCLDGFIKEIKERNLRNSIFIDVTANSKVAGVYGDLLKKSVSIVACNKIACSATYDSYKSLKQAAAEYNALFLFETNVGAGLPIIGTLNDLLRSGDKIHSIQAVLSGTLNFVFNLYNAERSFASVVKDAQDQGYTEPDPRLDLGGTDVMRKIMILARESGYVLEMEDIANHSFMPASCMEGTVQQFYDQMEKHEAHFQHLYHEATEMGCKLKFVAKFENGKASVGLQHIPKEHDLYHLYGKDNVVLFYTSRYVEQPLVIKGAGAGAEVTASGVFADIIRAAAPRN